jgi:quercetin dioxygenase-like cupin family protein
MMYVSKKLYLFNTQVQLLNASAIIPGGFMRIKQYAEVEATHFDSGEAKAVAARVVIGKKDHAENFFMRVFAISPGGHTPKHAHDWEHEMFVHAGAGEIFGNGQWNPMKAGNVMFVPANEVHQMKNTGQETLVVVCLVPAHAPEL